MKPVIVLRDCRGPRKSLLILAECIPLGFSSVHSTVAEARAKVARVFGNVEVRNLTSQTN